jgi:hypothetical chaperone protein
MHSESAQAPCVAGFDYGTSHCSIGLWRGGRVQMVPLQGERTLIESTLYAPKADFQLELGEDAALDLTAASYASLRFGTAALDAYLEDPTEGYFVKSPKSFLGAPGLAERVKERFISVVAAMMANVKAHADHSARRPVTHAVIGRPVNFQGAGGEAENQQALSMLAAAAREAGFEEVSFLFEPMAAALDYESRLDSDQRVLVVDIGGGTTDCSFLEVGPERARQRDRTQDILGHAGERLGGNDYDQLFGLHTVMPELGFGDELKSGLPIPNTYFVDALAVNDVNAQQRFYSRDSGARMDVFVRDALIPQRAARLRRLRDGRSTYRLLRQIELGKIALSDQQQTRVDLAFLESGLGVDCNRAELELSTGRLLAHLEALISEVLAQAQVEPDAVYLTGGMARSTVVRDHLRRICGDRPLVDSDHFAAVTAGLTLWAARHFGCD